MAAQPVEEGALVIGGIDFSTTAIDIVLRSDSNSEAHWRRCPLSVPGNAAERDAILARQVPEVLPPSEWWDGVWLCGIEYPFVLSFGTGLKTILGALMASVPPSVHLLPLPPAVWTPWFLRRDPSAPLPRIPRKSAERKPLIQARALELLDSDAIFPQDAYDAFGISWAAEEINRPAVA